MCEMWTNFAKHLTPTVMESESVDLAGVEWETVDPADKRVLIIDNDLEMGVQTEWEERMLFWDNILEEGC